MSSTTITKKPETKPESKADQKTDTKMDSKAERFEPKSESRNELKSESRSGSPQASKGNGGNTRAAPMLGQTGTESQQANAIVRLPIGLSASISAKSVQQLNQLLADSITLRDLYKKHHWQVVGPTFHQLHILFDTHAQQQSDIIDALAERVQVLGGVAIAMAADVVETTDIPRPPRGREEVPVQLSRLLEAHELIIVATREAAKRIDEAGDLGTSDLLVSEVLRPNELQVWFLAEHLVDSPLVQSDADEQ